MEYLTLDRCTTKNKLTNSQSISRSQASKQIKLSNFFIHASLTLSIPILCLSSCMKLIEIGPPNTELVTETVFNNDATANAAAISIYSEIANEDFISYQIPFYTGIASDELKLYSQSQDETAVYTNTLLPTNEFVSRIWQLSYKYIYQANAIIENIGKSKNLSTEISNQVKGEALFFRAFWYFYLINLYSDIPLILNTDYKENSLAKRESTDNIYTQIISDLNDSIKFLSDRFVGGDGRSITDERTRINVWSAKALLSRVYLYTKNYAQAEETSNQIIVNEALFKLKKDLNEVFLKNSSEAIWQLQPQATTPEAQFFVLTGLPSIFGNLNASAISQQLLDAFESGDLRKEKWLNTYENYYFPFKLKLNSGSNEIEYSMVLRLAEQFLIRSEARAELDNLADAASDLNIIRSRAGLPSITQYNRASLLGAIQQERRIELFSEFGHRWFDLKRTKGIDVVMPALSTIKGGNWNTTDQLLPIPQVERNNNPNLTQNAGY